MKKKSEKTNKSKRLREQCNLSRDIIDRSDFEHWIFESSCENAKSDCVKQFWQGKYGLDCPYRQKPDPKYYDSIPTNSKIFPIGKDPNFSPVVYLYESLPFKGQNHKSTNAFHPQENTESCISRWPEETLKKKGGKFAKPRGMSAQTNIRNSSSFIDKIFDDTFEASLGKIDASLALSPNCTLQSKILNQASFDNAHRISNSHPTLINVVNTDSTVQRIKEWEAQERIKYALNSIVSRENPSVSNQIYAADNIANPGFTSQRPRTAPIALERPPMSRRPIDNHDNNNNDEDYDISGIGYLGCNVVYESSNAVSLGIDANASLPRERERDFMSAIGHSNSTKHLTAFDVDDIATDIDDSDIEIDDIIDNMIEERKKLTLQVSSEPSDRDPSTIDQMSKEIAAILQLDIPPGEVMNHSDAKPTTFDTLAQLETTTSAKQEPASSNITTTSTPQTISVKQRKSVRLSITAGSGKSSPSPLLRRSSKSGPHAADDSAFSRVIREIAEFNPDEDDPLSQAVMSRMTSIASAANLKVSSTSVKGRKTLHFQDAVSLMTGDKSEIKHKFLAAVKRVNLSSKEKMKSKLEAHLEHDYETEHSHPGIRATESSKVRIMKARKALNLVQSEFHYEKEFDQILEAKRVKWQDFCDKTLELGCEVNPSDIQIGNLLFRGKIMSIHNGILLPEEEDEGRGMDEDDDGNLFINAAKSKPVILKVARFGGNLELALNLFGRIKDEEIIRSPQPILTPVSALNTVDYSQLDGGEYEGTTIAEQEDNKMMTDEFSNRRRKSSLSNSKYPPEAIVQEYKNELTALHELGKHPNIVALVGVTLAPFALVIEKMDGILGDCLENADWQYQCSVKMRTSILRQIAAGLAHMHNKLYVHRDINPKNISYRQNPDGNLDIKIGDLQKAIKLNSVDDILTIPAGTAGYTAPEVYAQYHYGIPSDIFSFGIVIWELFAQKCRRNPLLGLEPFVAATKIENNIRPPFGPEHPILMLELARRCWESHPGLRPTSFSVEMMLNDLLVSDENFYHIYDRAFAKEALDLVVREHRHLHSPGMRNATVNNGSVAPLSVTISIGSSSHNSPHSIPHTLTPSHAHLTPSHAGRPPKLEQKRSFTLTS